MRPFVIIAAASFAVLSTVAPPVWAQANRTFVSGRGDDTNPCTLPAPCRSFAQALTQTNAGGEITVLDPAGYGTVTITKSVSIVNDGVGEAGVTTASGTDAIIVTIGAGDVVNLRGLTLVGGGVGSAGIRFTNLGTLNIQNCVIRDFFQGVSLLAQGPATLTVSDTIVSNLQSVGFDVQPLGSGNVTAVFNRVQAISSGDFGFSINGAAATGTLDATIADSMATDNGNGIMGQSFPGQAVTQVVVVDTVLSNNATGIVENGPTAAAYLARNTIAGNTTAFTLMNSGALFSFGDNHVKSNGSDGGAISLVSTK